MFVQVTKTKNILVTSNGEILQEISSYDDVWIVPVKAGLDYMRNPLSNEQLIAAGPISLSSSSTHNHHEDHDHQDNNDHLQARQVDLLPAATLRSKWENTDPTRTNAEMLNLAGSLLILRHTQNPDYNNQFDGDNHQV